MSNEKSELLAEAILNADPEITSAFSKLGEALLNVSSDLVFLTEVWANAKRDVQNGTYEGDLKTFVEAFDLAISFPQDTVDKLLQADNGTLRQTVDYKSQTVSLLIDTLLEEQSFPSA